MFKKKMKDTYGDTIVVHSHGDGRAVITFYLVGANDHGVGMVLDRKGIKKLRKALKRAARS